MDFWLLQAFPSFCDAGRQLMDSLFLAGVYFEKYVKGKLGQTLWIRNLQLSIYGVPLSLAYTYLKDGRWALLLKSLRCQHATEGSSMRYWHLRWALRSCWSTEQLPWGRQVHT